MFLYKLSMSYYRIIFIHTCISLLKKTLPSDQQHHISSIASAASHQQHHSSITSAASHQQHHLNSDHFHRKPNVLIFFLTAQMNGTILKVTWEMLNHWIFLKSWFLAKNKEKVDHQFLHLTAKDHVIVLLYVSQKTNSENSNQNIIKFFIKHLKSTGRFDRLIFNGNQYILCFSY